MKKWKCKKSEIILDTKFLRVRKDLVELPTKEQKEWVYWDSKDSAMVIGMTGSKVVMISQYRYLPDDEVIEFPSGGLEGHETPEECAKREFEEETGYKCNSLVKLGAFYETFSQLNRKIHIFFSNDIVKTSQKLDSGEDISVMLVDFKKAMEMTRKNGIVSAESALAVLLLKAKIDAKEIKIG